MLNLSVNTAGTVVRSTQPDFVVTDGALAVHKNPREATRIRMEGQELTFWKSPLDCGRDPERPEPNVMRMSLGKSHLVFGRLLSKERSIQDLHYLLVADPTSVLFVIQASDVIHGEGFIERSLRGRCLALKWELEEWCRHHTQFLLALRLLET